MAKPIDEMAIPELDLELYRCRDKLGAMHLRSQAGRITLSDGRVFEKPSASDVSGMAELHQRITDIEERLAAALDSDEDWVCVGERHIRTHERDAMLAGKLAALVVSDTNA